MTDTHDLFIKWMGTKPNITWRVYRENEERRMIKLYESLNWKLICITHDKKEPVSGIHWTKRTLTYENAFHLIGDRMNIAVDLIKSKLIVADIDMKTIPDIFKPFIEKTMSVSTPHGYHIYFNFDGGNIPEIDTVDWRGGNNKPQYTLLPPSVVNKLYYEFITESPLMKFSEFIELMK